MDLKQLGDKMEQAMNQGIFLFTDASTFGTGQTSKTLMALYQTESLSIQVGEFKKPTQEKEEIYLLGKTWLQAEGNVSIILLFSYAREKRNTIVCDMTVLTAPVWLMPLKFHNNLFFLTQVEESVVFTEDDSESLAELRGLMQLGDKQLLAEGSFLWKKECWEIKAGLGQGESLPVRELLSGLFSLLSLEIPADVFPDFSITNLIFSHTSESPVSKYSMDLSFTTNAKWMLTQYLGIRDMGAGIKIWDSYHEFSVTGNLIIGKTSVPMLLIYRSENFFLGVDTRNGDCCLPSISDICLLAGLDAGDIFPNVFGDITLHYLMATMPSSLNRLSYFSVDAYVTEDWRFFGLDSVVLRKIEVSLSCNFTNEQSAVSASIAGYIEICGLELVLCSSVSKAGWTFKAAFQEGEELNLNSLICGLAQLLFGEKIVLPLPECIIRDTSVSFGLTEKEFHGNTTIAAGAGEPETIRERLFAIHAVVQVDSFLIGKERSYEVTFTGTLMIAEQEFQVSYSYNKAKDENILKASWKSRSEVSPLNLVNLLTAMGVTGIPELIDSLSLSLDAAAMYYDFEHSVLKATVINNRYGEISFEIKDSRQKPDYRVIISLKEAIRLSNLPVVGTSLHLLDDLALEEVKFYISSMDSAFGSEKIQPGAAMTGKAAGTAFLLQISTAAQEAKITNDKGKTGLTKWFSIEKTFSMFTFHRLGIGIENGAAAFYLDAAVSMQPLSVSMMGLGLLFPLADPGQISFALEGMGIDVKKQGLEIGGSFLREGGKGKERYEGRMKIQVNKISIFAIGSYEEGALFAYAVASVPLGGPPVCFITGLAAGFGYNEDIFCPQADKMAQFPLVAGALGTISSDQLAASLSEHIFTAKGKYFLAGGIRFTSFQMIQSFALLFIRFGKELEIDLLGLSELNVPFDADKSAAIAHAQLALKASFAPAAGVCSIVAQLTSESYILSKSCKLTGGFACYVWFGGEHQGDFVLTLGGYHENYKKPLHYPDVPRVGFNWQVDHSISLCGEMYFGLTPASIMAGGKVEAVFAAGPVKAWFIARVDFWIQWKPLFYDINIQISLGASIRIDFLFIHQTFSLELGAGLHIWGPEFSGTAHIKWFIISFTIHFGADSRDKADSIDWSGFRKSFLPVKDESSKNRHKEKEGPEESCSETVGSTIQVTKGLLRSVRVKTEKGEREILIVRREELELLAGSPVPITEADFNHQGIAIPEVPLGVLPMGEDIALSTHFAVGLDKVQGFENQNEQKEHFIPRVQCENVPSAMWGLSKDGDSLVKGVATGIFITPEALEYTAFPAKQFFNLLQLSIYARIEKSFNWNKPKERPKPYEQRESLKRFSETVMKADAVERRKGFAEEMKKAGLLGREPDGRLSLLSQEADDLFDEELYLGGIL